jgi:hypothetical protein
MSFVVDFIIFHELNQVVYDAVKSYEAFLHGELLEGR